MSIVINGRSLGVAENGVFTEENTDPIPQGKLWTEAALTWNAMVAAYIADGGHPYDFVPKGPNSSSRGIEAQLFFWDQFQHHGGAPAAQPYFSGGKWHGTSNHGWGLAVDVKTTQAAAWLLIHGPSYGWSHDEGLRVGEWWHFRYIGAPLWFLKKLTKDPFAGYTKSERRWIKEYDHLKKMHLDRQRRVVLRRVMTAQRKRIWAVAQPKAKGGDGKGWTTSRRRRYNSLKARTA